MLVLQVCVAVVVPLAMRFSVSCPISATVRPSKIGA